MIKKYFALAGILIFLITACGKKTDKNEIGLNEKLNFSNSEYIKVFISKFTSLDSSIIKQDSLIQYYDTLKYFYSSKNFEPVFIKSFEDKEILYSLLIVFEKAEEHGLNPEQYHYSKIVDEFSKAIDTLLIHSDILILQIPNYCW